MIFSATERMIAFRYLRARRKEGFVSVIAAFSLLGVALGVAALIIVMAVMNGFDRDLMGRILGFSGHVNIYSGGVAGGISDFDKLAEKVRGLEEVTRVTPMVEGQVMITARNQATGALVKGMRLADIEKKELVTEKIIGNLELLREPGAVMIGSALANTLGIGVGDTITLISPQSTATMFGMVPRLKTYMVAATFEAGMYQYDNSTVFMPLESAQLFFQYKDQVTTLEVMVKKPKEVSKVTPFIAIAAGEQYRVLDWQITNGHFFNALQIERTVMFLILTLIILVAAFNIISSLIMLVNDKGGDIAILRTMGASRAMVMRIFFLCGSSIGVVGTMLGVILGLAFSLNIETIRKWLEALTGTKLFDPVIYYLSQLPADVQAGDVTRITLMALSLSFLATLYPAWKASTLNPAEALRYE